MTTDVAEKTKAWETQKEELQDLKQRITKLEHGQQAVQESLSILIEETRGRKRSNTTTNEPQVPALATKVALPTLPAKPVSTAEQSLDRVLVSVRVIVDLTAAVHDTKCEHFKDVNLILSAEHCKTVSKLDAKASFETVPGLLEELKFDNADLKDLRRASCLTLHEPEFDQPFGKSIDLTGVNDHGLPCMVPAKYQCFGRKSKSLLSDDNYAYG